MARNRKRNDPSIWEDACNEIHAVSRGSRDLSEIRRRRRALEMLLGDVFVLDPPLPPRWPLLGVRRRDQRGAL